MPNTGTFDEIARKNCPRVCETGTPNGCWACHRMARLAQATMEATAEHSEACINTFPTNCVKLKHCQSDILRRTEEKLK